MNGCKAIAKIFVMDIRALLGCSVWLLGTCLDILGG